MTNRMALICLLSAQSVALSPYQDSFARTGMGLLCLATAIALWLWGRPPGDPK